MQKNVYWQLFFSTLRVSACTFGGGFVIVPILKKRFVEELGWIDETEMMDITVIAQSAPGAIAVNASILVGYRVAGVRGAMAAIGGTILPPLVIISLISLFFQAFRENPFVSMAMRGVLCGVSAVLCGLVFSMGQSLLKPKKVFPVLIFAGAFAAYHFFGVSVAVIIVVCALLGAAEDCFASWKDRRKHV